MKQIIHTLVDRTPIRITFLLCALLTIFFWNVVVGNSSFLTSEYTFLPNTMPNGPYGYTGHRVTDQPTRDSGSSSWQAEPLNRLTARMVKVGQLPLWNPYVGAGAPLAANMHSGVFYPLSALTYLFPDSAWTAASNLSTLLGFFIAGYFAYLFLKSIGVGELGSLGSAIAYMFCGYLLFFINTADWRVETLIPMLVFGAEKVFAKKSLPWIFFVAIAVFLSITAGMPEPTFFALLLASSYFAFRAFSTWARDPRDIRQLVECLGRFAAAVLLGVGLAAFLILPFLEYAGVSQNSNRAGTGMGNFAPETAISILVPYFFGGVDQGWNGYNLFGFGTVPYIGTVVTFLALLSFRRRSEFAALTYFWAGAAIIYILKAFGSPLIQWMGSLPLFNISYFPRFAAAPFMFSTAVLAGIGIDNLRRGKVSLKGAIAATAVVGIFIGGLTIVNWPEIIAFNQVEYVGLQIGLEACFLVAAWVILFFIQHRIANTRLAALLFVVLMAGDLFIAAPKDRADKYDPYTTPPFANFLQNNDHEPFRVVGLDFVLYPDTAGVYGLEDIRALDALYPGRYATFIQNFIDPTFVDRFTGQNTVYQDKFLDLLNVKYILSQYPLLDRWTSTDLTLSFAQAGESSSPPLGILVDKQDGTVTLRVRGTAIANGQVQMSQLVRLPQDRSYLRFEIGQAPNTLGTQSAGQSQIQYGVSLKSQDGNFALFSKSVGPAADASWTWTGQVVDLTRFQGESVTLEFDARCNGCLASAEGAWRNIELIYPSQDFGRTVMSAYLPVDHTLRVAQGQAIWEYNEEIQVYKSDSAFPRAFVVHNALLSNSGDETLQKMSNAGFDPGKQVVIEGAAADEAFDTSSQTTSDFAAPKITQREPGRVAVQVSMDQPGFMVLTNTSYPGWKAIVDGREAKVYTADYLFQAVYLDRGGHQIEFVYDPMSYRIGFVITLTALCVGVLSYIYSRWAESRRAVAK